MALGRMAKICAIPQLVSAPLNPTSMVRILEGAIHNVRTVTDNVYQ